MPNRAVPAVMTAGVVTCNLFTSLNEGQMKKYILGALLVGGLAGQSAFAEVRTFDFTANISSLAAAGNPFATSLSGIESGTTIAVGDAIKGQLSFDDLGTDWNAATGFLGWNSVTKFSYTFVGSNTTVDVAPALWGHTANIFGGSTNLFNAVGSNAARTVASNLFLYSPGDAFSWELGDGTSASLSFSWLGNSASANVSSLVEVTPVPEPSTYAMLLLGAAVVGGVAKRRARRAA